MKPYHVIAAGLLAIGSVHVSSQADAQVLAASPGGYGYVATPNPISPPCPAPKLWLLVNGVYSCQLPPSGGGGTGGGGGGNTPSDPQSKCEANAVAAGYTIPNGLAATMLKIGSYTQVSMCYVNGPYYDGGGPNGGTQYAYECFFNNATGAQQMPDRTMVWSYCQGYSGN